MSTVTGGAPAPVKKSHAKLDTLIIPAWATLPDGRAIGSVPPEEFRKLVTALGIAGVDASKGYASLAAAYVEHLQTIYDAAGRARVAEWLGGSR